MKFWFAILDNVGQNRPGSWGFLKNTFFWSEAMKVWALGMAAAVLSASVVGTTFGETVDLTSTGHGAGLAVSFGATGVASYSNEFAGQYDWTASNDTPATTFGSGTSSVSTYCIQLGQVFSYGNKVTYNVVGLGTDTAQNPIPNGGPDQGVLDPMAAKQIQLFVDRYYGDTTKVTNATNWNTTYSNWTFSGSYDQNEVDAAFQLAVWEIEYDGGQGGADSYATGSTAGNIDYFGTSSPNKGIFTASGTGDAGTAISLANTLLNSFALNTVGYDSNVSSIALTNNSSNSNSNGSTYQDQFIGIPHAIPSIPTPLPASLPAGLAMLAGLGIFGKIRSKRRV